MLDKMEASGMTAVSVPKLGSGLDKLNFDEVLNMMEEEVARRRGVTVTVYSVPPKRQ